MQRRLTFAALAAIAFAAPAAAQDTSLAANFGEVTLEAGFVPDPHQVRITAGGTIDASTISGASCVGKISAAPDYKVNYTGGGFPLVFRSFGASDTTLVINDAQGNWHCDDDSGTGLNAQIVFYDPPSGVYDIWVGTFGEEIAPSKLTVSELLDVGTEDTGG
jgi:hypothetical protein